MTSLKCDSRGRFGFQLPSVNLGAGQIFYQGVGYDQASDGSGASIPLPFQVYASQGTTSNLGTITVPVNDPRFPPPPPF